MATVTKSKKRVEIENVGAVKHLALTIPEEGGIVVLRGRNGQGKTTALEAAQSVLSGNGSLEVNDKALSGSVDAFGVTLTVGKSTRRKGELEVQSIEGRLSLGDLIDPQLKTPEAADTKRIKALVQLSGVEASPELFYDLIGKDELRAIARPDSLQQKDPVSMAEAIKRDLEAAARREEDSVQKAEGSALGATEALGDLDLRQPSDADKLQAAFEAAVTHESQLKAQLESSQRAERANADAKARLQEQEAAYSGPSLEECRNLEAFAKTNVDAAQQSVNDAEIALASAREHSAKARAELSAKIDARKAAERHEAVIASAKESLQQMVPPAPSQEELDAATEAVFHARRFVERGALIRKGLQHLAAKDLALEAASKHRKNAGMLRDAAKATDEVLSGIVQKLGTSLRVQSGRLVIDTHRGETYFHELSDGERAKIAIDIAIGVVGEGGVLTLDQHIFEGLDPINRGEVAKLLKSRKATMLTAEVSADEEIQTEVL